MTRYNLFFEWIVSVHVTIPHVFSTGVLDVIRGANNGEC